MIRFTPILLLASCATIMNTAPKHVQVTSTPPGAAFTSNAPGVQGVTPAIVQMPRGDVPVTLTFTLDGYATLEEVATPRLSRWVAGNIIFGGLLGILVDVVNPNARVHHDVSVNLLPLDEDGNPIPPPPAPPKKDRFGVIVQEEV